MLHERVAHYTVYTAHNALLALLFNADYFQSSARGAYVSLPIAALHGLSAAFVAIGTRTVPTLILPVAATVLVWVARPPSRPLWYAAVFSIEVLMVSAGWFLHNGGTMPTFDDINKVYKVA